MTLLSAPDKNGKGDGSSVLMYQYEESGFTTSFFLFLRLFFFMLVTILTYLIYSFDQILSTPAKILIYWGCLALLFILSKIQLFKRAPWRLFFTMIAAFLTLRYLYWRTFETLTFNGIFDFMAMAGLYLAELHGITLHLISMFINIWPINRGGLSIKNWKGELPTVDVFIPTYMEADEIIKITCTAAKNMDYPKDKFKVYILDDGGTVQKRNDPDTETEAWDRHYRLRTLAKELGVEYITRERNINAKSGNLNHALAHTNGELILVLDCDHVPTRDFLTNTVGYFLVDEDLYLVQTPHFFMNPTPIEKNMGASGKGSVENDMFFRLILLGLDFWNACYFCGSAALLRRKHLDIIGGISGETITEDAETALALQSLGYNSIYVSRPMVCGLSPDTFDDYIVQRSRWAQGMLQIFILKNPLFLKGLTIPQRICYFNSCFFWFFSLARFMYYIGPSLFLFFGLMVYNASVGQIMVYAMPYVISTTIVMDFFFGKTRQPFFSEIYETVQALFLLPAVISVLINPREPEFKVTPKGAMVEREHLNPMASSFIILIIVNLAAVCFGIARWIELPLYRDVTLITSIWCIYNIVILTASLGTFWERRQVRKHHRISVSGKVRVTISSSLETAECELADISLMGLSFTGKFRTKPNLYDKADLDVLDEYGEKFHFAGVLQRVSPKGEDGTLFCGVQFHNVEEDFAKHVLFVYGNSYRWADIWYGHSDYSGTPEKLGHLFAMGVKGAAQISFEMAGKYSRKAWQYTSQITKKLRKRYAVKSS